MTDDYQIRITITMTRIADSEHWTNATQGLLASLAKKYQGNPDSHFLIRSELIQDGYEVNKLVPMMTPSMVSEAITGSCYNEVERILPTFMTDNIV